MPRLEPTAGKAESSTLLAPCPPSASGARRQKGCVNHQKPEGRGWTGWSIAGPSLVHRRDSIRAMSPKCLLVACSYCIFIHHIRLCASAPLREITVPTPVNRTTPSMTYFRAEAQGRRVLFRLNQRTPRHPRHLI